MALSRDLFFAALGVVTSLALFHTLPAADARRMVRRAPTADEFCAALAGGAGRAQLLGALGRSDGVTGQGGTLTDLRPIVLDVDMGAPQPSVAGALDFSAPRLDRSNPAWLRPGARGGAAAAAGSGGTSTAAAAPRSSPPPRSHALHHSFSTGQGHWTPSARAAALDERPPPASPSAIDAMLSSSWDAWKERKDIRRRGDVSSGGGAAAMAA